MRLNEAEKSQFQSLKDNNIFNPKLTDFNGKELKQDHTIHKFSEEVSTLNSKNDELIRLSEFNRSNKNLMSELNSLDERLETLEGKRSSLSIKNFNHEKEFIKVFINNTKQILVINIFTGKPVHNCIS